MNDTKTRYYIALEEFYQGDVPNYIDEAGKTFVKVHAGSEWEGSKLHKITLKDVVKYYHGDARNISSGYRSVGSIGGDWRPIDNLAKELLEWFKYVNHKGLETEGKKYGMTLR